MVPDLSRVTYVITETLSLPVSVVYDPEAAD